MCEIFPEVSHCCFFLNLRIGMLIISVLGIMTGVTGLCGMEKITNISYSKVKNVTAIKDSEQALSQISLLIPTTITAMSCIFMFTGVILLFATLADAEGYAQVFVWLTFLAVIVGFFMVVATAFECIMKDKCLLSGLDWLSGVDILHYRCK
ncbi:uncharacterized protein [Epargyreus clarus]|uniref:uncharacterized protein isoform X2 n=1 Tax=Epargyreus clarus TaxID=520877 RepID=UPI003C304693